VEFLFWGFLNEPKESGNTEERVFLLFICFTSLALAHKSHGNSRKSHYDVNDSFHYRPSPNQNIDKVEIEGSD